MEKVKKVVLWCLTVMLLFSGIGYLPSIFSFASLIIAVIIVPIQQWQDILSKVLKGKVKAIAIAVLVIVMCATVTSIEPIGTDKTSDTTEKNVTEVSTTKDETSPVGGVEATTDAEEITTETAPVTENGDEVTTDKPEADETENQVNNPTQTPTQAPSQAPTQSPTQTPPVTEQETKPVHTHSFKAATCTTPKTCTSCGATEGSALGHSWADATYSSPKKCTRCGITEGNALDVPNKENYHGHVYTGGSNSKKYHYEADCAGKYSHEITWEEVENRNLGPCGTCVLK